MIRKVNNFPLACGFLALAALFLLNAPPAVAASSQSQIIEAARQEGELNWTDAVIVPASAKKIGEAFKKRYGLTNLKINHNRLNTGQVTSRVMEEVRADRVTIDIFAAAVPAFFYDLKDAGALLNYESPEYKHYTRARKAGLTYETGYWQSAIGYAFAPCVNPKYYPKKMTSWYDLLDPLLKGSKIQMPNASSAQSPLYTYVGWRKVLPYSYFEKLAVQQVVTGGTSSVEQVQKLMNGEHIVAVTNPFRLVQLAKRTGVHLDAYFPKEGVVLLGHPYGILAKAKHPNAAKLFVDFLFSEEGMSMYVNLEGIIVLRDGMKVPEEIKRYSPPLAEINAIPMDWKNLDTATLQEAREEWQRVFKR